MQIVQRKISELNPAKYNPRKIDDRELEGLKQSIKKWGMVDPIIVNKRNNIIVGGHQRVRAAEMLGMSEVPTVEVDLSPTEEKALNIALNSPHISGKYDEELLSSLLSEIKFELPEFEALRFDEFEIPVEKIEGECDPDEVPEIKPDPVTKRGDVWLVGKHRLMCGDSTMIDDVEKLMNGQKVDMVFTSPPYNCAIKYNKYDDAKDRDDYILFINSVISNCFLSMKNGRMIFWNCGSSPKSHAHAHALEQCGFFLRRQIIWKKTGCQIPLWQNSKKKQLARYYLPNYTHENIFMASVGEIEIGGPTIHNDIIGNDVWEISQFAAGGNNHPAAFPVELAEMPIISCTNENELLFEPFCGSGSTIIACEKTNRICYGMELDEQYCDVVISRYLKYSGRDDVILESTGQKFTDLQNKK